MTPKEALQETYRRKEIAEMTAENEVVEYYNTVVEALEKQMPKKPMLGVDGYMCTCGAALYSPRNIKGELTQNIGWCSRCGRAINWTEEE